MKQSAEFDKIDKQNQDLKIIENSLFKAWNKDKREVATEKNSIVFKIVDNCIVSPAKAKEYLSILASRNIVRLDKEMVYYEPTEQKLKESQRLLDSLDTMVPKS
jgi:hypothetical protein